MFKSPSIFIDYTASCEGVWEYVSNYTLSLLITEFYDKDIITKIKAKFGLEPYLWQINVVTNINHHKKNVFIIADTNVGKSLTYQSIPEII